MTVSTPQTRQQAAASQLWLRRGTTKLRVVLVEPSRSDARPLEADLRSVGVEVVSFEQAIRAMVAISRIGADAVIASANLGKKWLRSTCLTVRDEFAIPVLLAYRPTDVDVIGNAVMAGGRPVLRLPYDSIEIMHALARIEAPPRPLANSFAVGDLTMFPDAHATSIAGRGVDLSPSEYRLLAHLAVSPDRAVPRHQLIAQLWNSVGDPDSALAASMRRLRRKLAAAGLPRAVHTVRGIGYRLDSRECAIADSSDVTRPSISSTIRATSPSLRPTGS